MIFISFRRLLPVFAVFVIAFLIPFGNAFATANDLLDSASMTSTNVTNPAYATDNDASTYAKFNAQGANITYIFSTPVDVGQFYVKATNFYNNANFVRFYDSSGNLLFQKNYITNDGYTNVTVKNVSKVVVYMASLTSFNLYEFEVYPYVDTVPPAIPSGLVATGGDGFVSLSWNANTEDDLNGYNVYQSSNGASFTKVNSSIVTTPNYTVDGLLNGETYYFAVTSVDKTGNESAKSASVFATPSPFDTVPPSEVTGLHSDVTDSTITLTFTNPVDSDFAYANVYLNGQLKGQTTTGSFALTGLSPETQYSVKVTTVDTSANESAGVVSSVKTASVVDTTAPSVPKGVQVSVGNSSLYIMWSANDESDLKGYNVYLNGVKVNTSLVTTAAYVIYDVNNGQSYDVEVTAVDRSGNESARSSVVSATPSDEAMPLLHLGYSLADVAHGTSEWFGSLWLVIAFATAIPLSFYVANRTKLLLLD